MTSPGKPNIRITALSRAGSKTNRYGYLQQKLKNKHNVYRNSKLLSKPEIKQFTTEYLEVISDFWATSTGGDGSLEMDS